MCECKFECCASYNGTAGAGSVIFGQCPFPDRKEKDCERHCIFTNMVADFQASGDKPAAALWKTRTTLNIPTAYDIGGEVLAWRIKYRPDSLPEIMKKQTEFIKSLEIKGTMIAVRNYEQPPEREQISIWEVMQKCK